MSTKRRVSEEAIFGGLDTSSRAVAAAKKLPGNMMGNIEQLPDFISIPCNRIVEYQDKMDSDFTPWPKDKFEELVESIRDDGMIDPVTVRAAKEKDGYYEMLAGEHRWKATIAAGLQCINAHYIPNCTDERARAIFSLTNTQRRENTLRDKINGWWHYLQATRFKRGNDIAALLKDGAIDENMATQAKQSYRNAARYAKMHDLIDEFLDLAEQKHLSIRSGEQIAYLPKEHQRDLVPYKHNINDTTKSNLLRQLSSGQLDGKKWSKDEIEDILFPKTLATKTSMKSIASQVGVIIREKLPNELHEQAPSIISDALDMYLTSHPECAKSK